MSPYAPLEGVNVLTAPGLANWRLTLMCMPKRTCRLRFERWWISLIAVMAFVLVPTLIPAETKGQTGSFDGSDLRLRPVEPIPTRLRRTYGGRVYMSFPNYDVILYGAPEDISGLTRGTENEWVSRMDKESINRIFAGGTVIGRNAQGLRWDGSGFLLHPAYPQEDVTRHRYPNRIVGEPQQQWPAVASDLPVSPHKQPFKVEPIVTHREPSVEGQASSAQDVAIRFLTAPWVVNEPLSPTEVISTEPIRIPQTTTTAAPYAYEGATQFLPAPWMVAPAAAPALGEKKKSERPDAVSASPTATTFEPSSRYGFSPTLPARSLPVR